eukprot:6067451-Ditylum_brightwellii.AAC.1
MSKIVDDAKESRKCSKDACKKQAAAGACSKTHLQKTRRWKIIHDHLNNDLINKQQSTDDLENVLQMCQQQVKDTKQFYGEFLNSLDPITIKEMEVKSIDKPVASVVVSILDKDNALKTLAKFFKNGGK